MAEKKSIKISTDLYIKLKNISEVNDSSVEEEISAALENFLNDEYPDILEMNSDILKIIEVISRTDKVFIILPGKVSSVVSGELEAILQDYIDSFDVEVDEFLDDDDDDYDDDYDNDYEEEKDNEKLSNIVNALVKEILADDLQDADEIEEKRKRKKK